MARTADPLLRGIVTQAAMWGLLAIGLAAGWVVSSAAAEPFGSPLSAGPLTVYLPADWAVGYDAVPHRPAFDTLRTVSDTPVLYDDEPPTPFANAPMGGSGVRPSMTHLVRAWSPAGDRHVTLLFDTRRLGHTPDLQEPDASDPAGELRWTGPVTSHPVGPRHTLRQGLADRAIDVGGHPGILSKPYPIGGTAEPANMHAAASDETGAEGTGSHGNAPGPHRPDPNRPEYDKPGHPAAALIATGVTAEVLLPDGRLLVLTLRRRGNIDAEDVALLRRIAGALRVEDLR